MTDPGAWTGLADGAGAARRARGREAACGEGAG
jgi:hypothetical protein